MSHRRVESLSHSSDKKYSDLWGSNEFQVEFSKQSRASEMLPHIGISSETGQFQFQTYHGRPLLYVPKPAVICDVGSGIGGVTLAYRRLLPEAKIVAMDVDPRARAEAERSGANAFLEADVTQLTERDWSRLARETGVEVIDQIVALKTKGEVALHLLEQWREQGLPSVLFLSLIQECDEETVSEIQRTLAQLDPQTWLRFFLYEGRNYHEVAWILLPHKE